MSTQGEVKLGQKRVPIQVTFKMHVSVPEDWDEESIRFWVEENHCTGNYVQQLMAEHDSRPGKCVMCSRAEAKVIPEWKHEDDDSPF